MNNCLGIINLDENQSRMGELVRYRTLASVPIELLILCYLIWLIQE